MKSTIYIFSLIIIFASCNKIKSKGEIVKNIPKDTINVPNKNNTIEKQCLEQTKGFKNQYGIVFSNYYRDESFSIDFDNNKIIDTIVILKPFYENSIDGCYPKNAEYDFPILLISKTINNKRAFFKIYKNALKINEANYYETISVGNNGFIILKDYNGNNGFFSKTYVSYKEPNFYVDSIGVESWGEHQYKRSIDFKNKTFELSKYKRTDIDSIKTILDNKKWK